MSVLRKLHAAGHGPTPRTGFEARASLRRLLAFAFAAMSIAWPAHGEDAGLQLLSVAHEPNLLDPDADESAAVSFETTEEAEVSLEIYDDLDRLVARIGDASVRKAGRHTLAWDGLDLKGRRVPPEAYRYVLLAKSARTGETSIYPAAPPGDRTRTVWLQATWSPDTGTIDYQLDRPSRVRVRVGLENDGPLLKTVVNWAVRDGGPQSDPWDGMDQSGEIDLSDHAALAVSVRAFPLPSNTILVGPPAAAPQYLDDVAPADSTEDPSKSGTHRMFDYANQHPKRRRDFPIELVVSGSKRDSDSKGWHPRSSADQQVTISIADEDLAQLIDEGFEAVYFVDGRRSFEAEVAFFPIVWDLSTENLTDGEHLLSVNLRGFDGHFGIASRVIRIESSPSDSE